MRRRTFIQLAGAAGVAGAVVANEIQRAGAAGALAKPEQVVPVPTDDEFEAVDIGLIYTGGVSFRAFLRRRSDMVRLAVRGYNLRIDRSTPGNPRLRLIDPTRDGACVITFPPQSVLEEVVPEDAPVPAPGAIRTRVARPSRLSFIIPKATVGSGIPYTTAGLLDWAGWRLNTTPAARAAAGDPIGFGTVRPAPPTLDQTSIEAPWWLQISPNRHGRFVGSTAPVVGTASGSGHTELWHARFATRASNLIGASATEGPSRDRTVRAIWSPDPDFAAALADPSEADTTEPFAASLTQADRASLVRLTSDQVLPGSDTGRVAIPVETLTLSSLGATLDLGQSFGWAQNISLVEWRHRSTFGREQYVRVVDRGYLLPFGHQASLVQISERQFTGSGSTRVAVLRQRRFIVVNQAVIDHDTAATIPTGGRQLPFGTVRIRTTITPSVTPGALPNSQQPVANCFFPRVGGSDLLFDVTFTDRDGQTLDTQMPMLFVKGAQAEDPGADGEMARIRAAWNAYQHPTRRWAQLSGRRVAYAQSLTDRPGATSVTTDRIRFDLTPLADESVPETAGLRRSWASMALAEVRLEEIESVSNNTLGATTLTYDPVYRSDGFGPTNVGGMWATLGGAAGLSLRFSRPPSQADQPGPGSDRAGGVITPDLEIRGLSRSLGVAAGDPQALRAGTFDPVSFFAGPASPKLLGGIRLIDVIEPVTILENRVAPPQAMSITSRRADDAIETAMLWTPDMKADPAGIFTPGSFRLDALTRTPLDGSDASPSTRVDGELTDFTVSIPSSALPIVALHVDRLTFSSRDGRPPDVDIDVRGVTFGGDLAYVAELAKYFDFGLGGVDIAVLPDRVAVTIGIALPDIAFGVYVLRNVRLAGGLDIPLSGDPVRIRFELSSRDDPFRLTVLGLGGGGYVLVAFGVDGLEALEMGFEAGADVTLDFGVVSASVSVVLGIVIIVDTGPEGDLPEIIAYYRVNGEVSISLVAVSITMTLELRYKEETINGDTTRTLYGRASLEVDVSVAFVSSPSVTLTLERSISSDVLDINVIDTVLGNENDSSTYDDYCDAYGAG
jgi:hypothetical protein